MPSQTLVVFSCSPRCSLLVCIDLSCYMLVCCWLLAAGCKLLGVVCLWPASYWAWAVGCVSLFLLCIVPSVVVPSCSLVLALVLSCCWSCAFPFLRTPSRSSEYGEDLGLVRQPECFPPVGVLSELRQPCEGHIVEVLRRSVGEVLDLCGLGVGEEERPWIVVLPHVRR